MRVSITSLYIDKEKSIKPYSFALFYSMVSPNGKSIVKGVNMKYYSEILNKTFDTEKECFDAEKAFAKEQKINSDDKKTQNSKSKKELALAIQQAEKEIDEADKLYGIAQLKAAKILDESNRKAEEILEEAQKRVRDAEKRRLDAIQAFNMKFGAYTKTITGEKALDEFNKAIQRFHSVLDDFWL